MLSTFFLTCTVIGGALVLAQLLLSAVAFGTGHGLHLHHGAHPGGATRAGIRGGSPRGPHHHHRGGARSSGGSKPSVKTSVKTNAVPNAGARAVNLHHWGHWAMAWMMGMLNFQGVVSGLTVFGLVGLAATAARRPGSVALEFGIVAAVVMMAIINGMLSMMTGLEKDGTVDLRQAVGKTATVYLGIPAKSQGQGKITVSLQQRSLEFPAVTLKDDLLVTGQKVLIVAVLEPAVMLVVAADHDVPDSRTLTTE